MEAFLKAWLPRFLLGDCTFHAYSNQGKCALLRKFENRLRGYADWLSANWRIVVIEDRDDDECEELKSRLEESCGSAGLDTRRTCDGQNWQAATRIAVDELEAWYFGNWPAV